MAKALILRDQRFYSHSGNFEGHIRIYKIPKSAKFPEGLKVSFSLVEIETGRLMVLLDNHAPFGYHLHTRLPEDKNFRVSINARTVQEALNTFYDEVDKIENKK